MNWRICALALAIPLLSACAPEPETAAPAPVPPITGAQIDSMQEAGRDAGLAQSEWVSVLRRDEGRRAVVHARRGAALSPEAQDEFCVGVRALTSPELEEGQTLEIYIIGPDGVSACR